MPVPCLGLTCSWRPPVVESSLYFTLLLCLLLHSFCSAVLWIFYSASWLPPFFLSSSTWIWITDCSLSLCSILSHSQKLYYIPLSLLFRVSNPTSFSLSSHDVLYRPLIPVALPVHVLLNDSAHDLLHLQATVLFLYLSMVVSFSPQKGHCWFKFSSCCALILWSLQHSGCLTNGFPFCIS